MAVVERPHQEKSLGRAFALVLRQVDHPFAFCRTLLNTSLFCVTGKRVLLMAGKSGLNPRRIT